MDATQKFTGKAEGYSKYRPGYPDDYLDYLISFNSLVAGSVVADVGSGTGILSGQLLDRGLTVLAVEPNADMRAAAEARLGQRPGFRSVAAAAEGTSLPDRSVDLVTAAQAFHWFDRERFRAECRRILKPGAQVALVWNSRIPSSNITMELDRICGAYCPNYVGTSGGIESMPGVFEAYFRDGRYEYTAFPNDEHYDLAGFIGRIRSSSYALTEGDRNYGAFVSELMELFARYSEGAWLTVPSETHSYLGHV